jgi:hypothetical protein
MDARTHFGSLYFHAAKFSRGRGKFNAITATDPLNSQTRITR